MYRAKNNRYNNRLMKLAYICCISTRTEKMQGKHTGVYKDLDPFITYNNIASVQAHKQQQ